MEVLLLFLGAVLGVIVDRVMAAGGRSAVAARRLSRAKKRALASDPNAVTTWLLNYYDPGELHYCSVSGVSQRIAFFADQEWLFQEQLETLENRLIVKDGLSRFPINDRLIELRRSHGQRLFNNPTYYTAALDTDPERGVQAIISETEYFAVITNLIALEEEVFRAISSGKPRAPLRDKYLPTARRAASMDFLPLSFGVNVGFVLKNGDKAQVVIQTRSRETVTYGGSRALFPSFGLAPLAYEAVDGPSLLYYNFIKEYLEEFYGYGELVDSLAAKRADPLWFMHLPEAVELDKARQQGLLKIVVLGFGIDCLSGTTTISMLAELADSELSSKIARSIIGNWEVAEPTVSDPSLELLDIVSDRLGNFLTKGQLHTGSAFTLERIQSYYSGLDQAGSVEGAT